MSAYNNDSKTIDLISTLFFMGGFALRFVSIPGFQIELLAAIISLIGYALWCIAAVYLYKNPASSTASSFFEFNQFVNQYYHAAVLGILSAIGLLLPVPYVVSVSTLFLSNAFWALGDYERKNYLDTNPNESPDGYDQKRLTIDCLFSLATTLYSLIITINTIVQLFSPSLYTSLMAITGPIGWAILWTAVGLYVLSLTLPSLCKASNWLNDVFTDCSNHFSEVRF